MASPDSDTNAANKSKRIIVVIGVLLFLSCAAYTGISHLTGAAAREFINENVNLIPKTKIYWSDQGTFSSKLELITTTEHGQIKSNISLNHYPKYANGGLSPIRIFATANPQGRFQATLSRIFKKTPYLKAKFSAVLGGTSKGRILLSPFGTKNNMKAQLRVPQKVQFGFDIAADNRLMSAYLIVPSISASGLSSFDEFKATQLRLLINQHPTANQTAKLHSQLRWQKLIAIPKNSTNTIQVTKFLSDLQLGNLNKLIAIPFENSDEIFVNDNPSSQLKIRGSTNVGKIIIDAAKDSSSSISGDDLDSVINNLNIKGKFSLPKPLFEATNKKNQSKMRILATHGVIGQNDRYYNGNFKISNGEISIGGKRIKFSELFK